MIGWSDHTGSSPVGYQGYRSFLGRWELRRRQSIHYFYFYRFRRQSIDTLLLLLLLLVQVKKWLSWWEGSARTRRTARWSSTSSWRWSPRRREKILNQKEMLFSRHSGLSVYVFKYNFINLHQGLLTKIVMESSNLRSLLVFWPGTIQNCPTAFKRWSRSFKILTDSSCMKVDAESEIYL